MNTQTIPQTDVSYIASVLQRYDAAATRRQSWESFWQECYDYALPQRQPMTGISHPGERRTENIFDGTALDAVDQLAASLLANLTPPWSSWFGLKPGPDLSAAEKESLSQTLEDAGRTMQAHVDRSNFAVEMHQCFLDLIVGGTACLAIEESEPGAFSALRFIAIPLGQVVLEEGANGLLDSVHRTLELSGTHLLKRYKDAALPEKIMHKITKNPQQKINVLESVLPHQNGYRLTAIIKDAEHKEFVLRDTVMAHSPFIAFRWVKAPGEIYGRSPVMKALPDIKTANKVVELVLKNASIAVTGIWQADDDGVLNPANIKLTPGSIIPKAVGSQGLKALDMPGRFDISELVLQDLRSRIRHALMADRLSAIEGRRMTATEVIERSAEIARILGATYGRLQAELLTPLIVRIFHVLRKRGEIPDLSLDGNFVELDYRSPLARAQAQRNIQNTLTWIDTVMAMGPDVAAESIDLPHAARVLGETLGVPSDLIRQPIEEIPGDVLQETE